MRLIGCSAAAAIVLGSSFALGGNLPPGGDHGDHSGTTKRVVVQPPRRTCVLNINFHDLAKEAEELRAKVAEQLRQSRESRNGAEPTAVQQTLEDAMAARLRRLDEDIEFLKRELGKLPAE